MSKKKNSKNSAQVEDLNDPLTRAEQKIKRNRKLILFIGIGILVVALLIVGYIYLIRKPAIKKADVDFGKAVNMENVYQIQSSQLDSAANAAALDIVIKEYESAARNKYDGGNNAKLMAAINCYRAGKYQKALDWLKDYDRKDQIIAATSKALEGDCYVNLGKFNEAINAFQAAVKTAKGNPVIEPYCMVKEATVQRHQGNFKAEAALYKKIIDTYPEYATVTGENYEAYYHRALAQSGEKK